ncbi:disulfide bond formation protein B [Paracoccus suum]|uniref:Disulfide bond formation protein B n=1 Tax=Paracoccus suum TaxID=2259340 RepID=A0A344PKJ0_9RHOB|nr:disulfide bond formation protein B [Paracoccus suum]AXC49895.1 disulfide bond formation protein B [Paracoccus suum]
MRTATARQIMLLAGLLSGLLLATVFGFQYAGYPPCELCILQRWPHVAALALGIVAWFMPGRTSARALAWAGVIVMLACAGIAFYHAGVEWKWWAGPAQCSGGASNIGSLSVDQLMAKINAAPVVRCDEPALLILGFSMAAWNVVASLLLAGLWSVAARRLR